MLKEKWEDTPSYIKYGLIAFLVTFTFGSFIYLTSQKTKQEIKKPVNKGNAIISKDNNRMVTGAKDNLVIKDENKTKDILTGNKSSSGNLTGKQLSNVLGVKSTENSASFTGKKINLKKIATNKYLDMREQINNLSSLPKDFLKKFKNEVTQLYYGYLKQNIVAQYGWQKIYKMDTEKIKEYYPKYRDTYITTIGKLTTAISDIKKYKTLTIKKCAKVFGKEKCSVRKQRYVVFKNIYIPYSVAMDLVHSNIDGKQFYIILGIFNNPDLGNKKVADKYFLFHKKYGWYGYESLRILRNAIQNNNYQIMYLYQNIVGPKLINVYNKDIIRQIQLILGTTLLK